ncbi:hypothetical protein [uncultured Adlercreutzia sp.]|uniref:type IV toxin-antitoxin system AbiEi family antitoxin domain-containing protein n=1 Tax=uncultured Adlercreutzia sp. TaxID=875803 RepID=UPI0026F399FC|nr:hypothetical protein [uncultured Adlercreutzia sp.]
MVKTARMLQEELSSYGDPKNKMRRLVRDGTLVRVTKGLYETDATTPPQLLAASICGPSYISFEYALAYYGMIPEAVPTVTSATFEKGRVKRYETPFGTFTFHDVPSAAFPAGIVTAVDEGRAFRIATPEKALCDMLWLRPPVSTYRDLADLLFADLRLEPEAVDSMNAEDIATLAELYRSTTIRKFAKYLKRRQRYAATA